jgi:protein TonB
MRIRNPNLLFPALLLSVFVHGGVLWLVSAGPRPVPRDKNSIVLTALFPAVPPPESPPGAVPPEAPPVVTESAAVPEEVIAEEAVAEDAVTEESAVPPADLSRAESSPPGPAGPREVYSPAPRPDLREAALDRYIAVIHGLIDRNKEYPYQARRQDQEGSVQIRFTLSRRGFLAGDPVMEKRSRYRLLNESALEAVKNAAPYPPFPDEIPEEEMSFQVVVSFSL